MIFTKKKKTEKGPGPAAVKCMLEFRLLREEILLRRCVDCGKENQMPGKLAFPGMPTSPCVLV